MSDHLERLLASAAADEPTEAELQRLEGRLAPLLGGPGPGSPGDGGGGPPPPASTVPAAAAPLAAKIVAGAVVASLAIGGVLWARAPATKPAPAAIEVAVIDGGVIDAGVTDADVIDADVIDAPTAPSTGGHPSRPAVTELGLLADADRALRAGDPRTALAATEVHRRQFATGGFREERERIAIEALVALGRTADARRRASTFLSRYTRSIHADRIRALVAR